MQIRYFNFLTEHTQTGLNSYLKGLVPAGVHSGLDLNPIVVNGTVSFNPGKYVLSSGLIVEEDALVTVGPVPSVSIASSQGKTIVGLGPAITTIQRKSVLYSLQDGLLLDSDLAGGDPYIILGWMYYDGSAWQYSSAPKITLKKSFEPATLFLPNIPGFNFSTYRAGYGPVHEVVNALLAPVKKISVPLNNIYPLTLVRARINSKIAGSSCHFTVKSPTASFSLGSTSLYGLNQTKQEQFVISTAGLVNCVLEIEIFAGSDFSFINLGFEQNPQFLGIL